MRILLAEDEKPRTKALVKIFERNCYTADAVYDGEEALKVQTESSASMICEISSGNFN